MSQQMQMRDFFISEGAMKVFAANHTDGRIRTSMLDIRDKCYHDKDEADIWYGDTKNQIARSRNLCGDVEVEGALEKLDGIYTRMVDLIERNNGKEPDGQ